MLCPTWRKNSGRNCTSHTVTNGSGLHVPTINTIKEENRSPSSIEDVGSGKHISNSGVKPQIPSETGSTCRGSCEVTLRRKSGDALGLGIAGGSDKGCPPTISCLRPGGIAHRSDCLQVGDLVLAVNGLSIISLKHDDILTVLRNAGEQVVLSIEYDLNHPCFDRPQPSTTVTKTCLVRLEKEGGGLGLTIRGGAYGPDESKSRSLTVTAIRAGGPAHRDGRIRVGDRVSAINGTDVTTATLRTALSHLDRSTECVLTIDYDVSVLDAVNQAQGPLLLEIDKPAGEELGVTLNVEEISELGQQDTPARRHYFIGAISAASIADRCGALFVGDQLLSVDGVTLEYTTLAEAYQLLKGSSISQSIRVEIVPRYLRALYAQQERLKQVYRNQNQNSSSQRSSTDDPPEYAVIVPNSKRSKPITVSHHGDNGPRGSSSSVRGTWAVTSGHSKQNGSHSRIENGGIKKTSPEKDVRLVRHRSGSNGGGRARNKQQMVGGPQLVTSASEKYKRADRRYVSSSSSNKTAQNNRGRSASAVGIRQGTPIHDLLPLSSGLLTASVSAVPSGQVCHSEVMEVALNCWARGGYGLILHRNQSISDQRRRSPLFVSYVERGSPADKSGVIQVGDRILAINDWCTENGTADEANHIVRNSTGPLTLTIEFDVIETVLPSSGVFTVKLAKRGQNLGIVLQAPTSFQKTGAIFISDVRTGSVAQRCGTLHAGDQILAIDNIPLDTCGTEEASRLLQRSSDIVKLRIKKNIRAGVDEYDTGASGSQTVVYTVELSRKNGPLGLTIAGTDDRSDPIFVSQLATGGLAEKTGAVRVGDRIIAINGQPLQGKRVSEALQILQQAGDCVSLKIARSALSVRTPIGQLSDQCHSRAMCQHTGSSCNTSGPRLVTLASGIHQDQFNERDTSDKLGTPVQSIDSAVESLEDSPLNDSQHPSTGSNRTSQNSKSSSISGVAHSDNGNGGGVHAEDLSAQLHRTLSTMKNSGSTTSQSSSVSNTATDEDPHYTQLGGEACPCQTRPKHTNQDQQEEWIRVLEALETVGETEMLKKLEESILSGSVPPCSGDGVFSDSSTKPSPPKPSLAPPFPLTNTILRHPYSNMTRSETTVTCDEREKTPVKMTLSTNCKPLSISTSFSAYEHIPFITTPISTSASPAPQAHCSTATISKCTSSMDRPTSPSTSSIQLSGTVTPCSETAAKTGQGESGVVAQAAANLQRPLFSSNTRNPRVPLEIYKVTLGKDNMYNDFGFSVSDGVHEKGVFVNKVRTGGPADSSGSMKPFDRILQVNGTSLQDLDCMLAVPLLAAAGDKIELLICRDPLMAASFRGTDSIEEEDEEETTSLVGQTTV